jgi:hypothetical protein
LSAFTKDESDDRPASPTAPVYADYLGRRSLGGVWMTFSPRHAAGGMISALVSAMASRAVLRRRTHVAARQAFARLLWDRDDDRQRG